MKPIIFSTPMVQAILEGRKTQTRRVVKPQPNEGHNGYWYSIVKGHHYTIQGLASNVQDGSILRPWGPQAFVLRCAPYQQGEVLWVRETWGSYGVDDPDSNAVYTLYRADYSADAKGYWHEPEHINWCDFPKWRSPIYMPCEDARIYLRVTNARVERVQDISWKDALSEGIDHSPGEDEDLCNYCEIEARDRGVRNYGNGPVMCVDGGGCDRAQQAFEDDCVDYFYELWDSINEKRGFGWATNPWVWVYEFERIEPLKEG